MFCNRCGAKLPDDSRFCIKCGNKLRVLSSTEKRETFISKIKKWIDKISSNPTLNIVCIIVFILFLSFAYKSIKDNVEEIDHNKKLAEITRSIIELKEDNTFLGSPRSAKKELKEYNSQILKGYFIIVTNSIMIIVSLSGGTFMGTQLIKLRKNWGA